MTLPNIRQSLPSFGAGDIAREAANRTASKLGGLPTFQLTDSAPAESLSNLGEAKTESADKPENEDLRKAFQDFVGQTLFSQMISSMRETTQGAAYFNGGQAEKIFQGQLDQLLSEKLSESSASQISDPMFKLFQLRRGS